MLLSNKPSSSVLKYTSPFSLKNSLYNQGIVESSITGKTICITGKLTTYKNRGELKSAIEAHGGKVADSVSSKTDYLVNNDINSTSSKNQKAKALNIPIITEAQLSEKNLL